MEKHGKPDADGNISVDREVWYGNTGQFLLAGGGDGKLRVSTEL